MRKDDEQSIRVLTIAQPWAWCVFHAGKDVENRGWRPSAPRTVLIHAGQRFDPDAARFLKRLGVEAPPEDELPRGVIIGQVRITGWSEDSPSRWAFREPGVWHWQLTGPVLASKLIPYRGMPGFCPPPARWKRAFR
jgi:hypothetical protein